MERLSAIELNYLQGNLQYIVGENSLIAKAVEELVDYKVLEQEVGCPLEVRLKITSSTIFWDDKGNPMKIYSIGEHEIVGHTLGDGYTNGYSYRDYKKTWWLKEDRSE